MDALTRRQFDRAMLAKERTLAIRVGDYASRDIKEASFEYGYIKGDTYKPGGTCAGSGKITFTSIITTFNKLDILHPEIGLLVGDAYQWVKMGEYFINDIEIDRNRNTTTLELMDGMFKLNREYVTDLHFPAEVREVIQEICLKTGIELANDYFGISAMRYHIEQVPEGKKLSFRDMLSAMTQMIGMSCFFNREGKMEIRDLTESNITINADSYFLHGLTKSEIEYQIAGITCKTDKKSLTVGMKTGRSLELDNVFMTQSALNDLYYKLKNLTYYPYNLNYQGHLLLEVGQWVTIQTNRKETFKVPVLSQSFTFKGGLRGRISADSKAGNDTQYSYEGTITKQIKQQDGIEAKIQAQIEAADAAFDAEFKKRKKEIDDGIELAKAKAEEVKQELSDTINQRFDSFDNGPLKEAKRKAEEALKKAGASSSLAQEAKQIGLDSIARLEAFKSQTTTTQTVLSGDLDALKRTIANDIRPKQAQAEAEIAKQVEALVQTKKELTGVKSAQATYEETTTRRLSELTNLANGKASKSELTQTAEELTSKIASVQVAHRNQGDRVSAIESNFKQRADSLDAGVSRLTEGLRSKADISSLNVTAENIRQSVKSLETNTQNKLNQKLSTAEFEVRAGSIRQEILNATKDKADKTLVVAEAGKLREEFSKIKVGSRNYAEDYDFSRGLWHYNQGDNSPQDWTISNGEYNVKGTTKTWKQFQIHSKEGSQASGKSSTALLDLEIGETYTLSFQGICYSGSSSVWLSLRANRTVSGNPEIMSGTFNLTSSWQTYQVTIPALTKPENFDFWRIILGYDEIGHVAFRKVELTRSSTRIDAGPAPEDGKTDLVVAKTEFEKTAEGLSAKMTAVERYVNQDGQRQESLQRYAREESAKQATAVREQISKDYVGKNTFQESVQGVERRLESLSLGTSGNLLKNSNDGFYNQHDKRYRLAETLQANQTYTLVSKYWHGENSTDHTFYNGVGKWQRLSYNKAIDAWVVQFTPTQEIPAGTEIVLSAVPNEAKGNMSWATLVRGAIPLIHWQPAKGDVEEGFTQKLAEYKETVDGRFATISSQINGKANQSDFQRVKETSQLYERIIGSNENDISNKVARMAMTNQLFQVEVSKHSGNGVNRAINTTSGWGPFITRSGNDGVNLHADLHKILSSGFKAGNTVHVRMEISIDDVQRFNDKQIVAIIQSYGDVTNWARAGRTFDYNIGTLQPGNNWRLIEFDTVMTEEMLKNNSWMLNLRVDGASSYKVHTKAVKVEKGNVASAWSAAPEDTDEAIHSVRTVQTQLAGSYAIQNLNSAGDIISGINLGANGHNRFDGKLTHITGETLIDKAVIKSAMIDKLKTANFEAGSVTTTILDAEAVTAEKVRFDDAFIRKMIANEAFINQLTSKRIFATKVESVVSSSTFLEAYQGRIGGFTIGRFDQGRGRWISGINQFSVGMGNGEGGSYNGENTAFWANWGYSWNYPGPNAWYVTTSGNMYCRNGADFHGKVDFSNRSTVNFYSQPSFSNGAVIKGSLTVSGRITYSGGEWLYSPIYNKLWKDTSQGGTWLYLDRQDNGKSDWIRMNKEISDRRYKSNIQDSQVSGLNVIEKLKTYSYRKEYDGKIEDISCGIMAQDVQKYAPEAFYKNPDGAYTYETFALVPYLIKAIQELNQKIEKMEKTIA